MHKIKRNKWNRRICKWIASLMTVALLINQSSFWVLAEESVDEVCYCDTRCSMDSVNGACPVCAEDYGKCGGAEIGMDTDTGEEPELPGVGEDMDTGADIETVPDTATDGKTENTDVGTDIATDEEADSDTDESVDTDADTDAVSEVDADDEAENIVEEDSVSSASVGDTFTDNGITYKIIDESNLQVEITDVTPFVSGTLQIPSIASNGINEYSVVGIRENAFGACSRLENVTIPGSVTSIGEGAFFVCSSLKSVTILDGVTSIGELAFTGCSSLKSVTIPGSVTSIGEVAFQGCSSLESVTIPGSVTSIGDGAFWACSSLRSITILDGVTSIGVGAFWGCSSLESVTIPGSVTSIGEAAFQGCSSLESVTILSDNFSIDDCAFDSKNLNNFYIAITKNITGTPSIKSSGCFIGCPYDRSLTFLTEDGTTVLSNTTTPTLAEAVEAYDAADGTIDGKWYDWKLPEVPDVTSYPVTINVNKDGSTWSDCGKSFALSANNGATFIADLKDVSNGKYTIYDITGASDSTGYVNTGVTVEVKDAAVQAEINYYSVTFYDDDTIFAGRIVPKNTKVSEPLPPPTKDGYTFYRWATSEDGSTEFDFNNPITAKTDVYASWIADAEELFTITAVVGPGGSVSPSGDVTVKSGADQQFTITPQEGYQISSVLVDGIEQLNTIRAIDHSKAGITDAANNVKYYDFENVTSDHTLAAYFEVINSGGDDSDNNGDEGSGSGDTNDNGGSGGSDDGDTGNNGTPDSSGGDVGNNSNSDSSVNNSADSGINPDAPGSSIPLVLSDTNVANNTDVISISNTAPATKDNEPKTGDASHTEIYATITMIAGLSYLLIYFADGKNGMTEDEKKEIVASLVNWAKKGSRIKKYAALAVIFLILVYYHSIGKRTTVDWKEVYEK